MPVSRKRRPANKPGSGGRVQASGGIHPSWYVLGAAFVAIIAGIVYWKSGSGGAHVDVTVPALTGAAARGETLFAEKCVACHGQNAAGSIKGPPLVHKLYEPGHHADGAFLLAVRRGVRAHHWRFGNMPPVQGVSDAELESIVAYVRALQRANGIP